MLPVRLVTMLLCAVLVLSVSALGQNYIGLHKSLIGPKLKKEYPGFSFEKEVVNGNRSFLKYIDSANEQTLLFRLSSKGVCISVSRMYNTWLYKELVESLNTKYQKAGSNSWIERRGKRTFTLKLKKGKWFVTLFIKEDS